MSFYFCGDPRARIAVAGVNPDGDDARETPVLTPIKAPSVVKSGDPDKIMDAPILVAIAFWLFDESAAMRRVTSPAAICGSLSPDISMRLTPRCAGLVTIETGTQVGI